MSFTSTRIIIQSTGETFNLPVATMNGEDIKRNYASSISGLQNMEYTETSEGTVRVFTFRPRTGNKGL